jgi:hypothetical protein
MAFLKSLKIPAQIYSMLTADMSFNCNAKRLDTGINDTGSTAGVVDTDGKNLPPVPTTPLGPISDGLLM